MTQFVMHDRFNNFLFSPFFNTVKKPKLKVNNIMIQKFISTPRKQRQKPPRNQIHEHQKTKSRNERTLLINKTIQLISKKNRPFSQQEQYRRKKNNSYSDRISIYQRKGHNVMSLSLRNRMEDSKLHHSIDFSVYDSGDKYNDYGEYFAHAVNSTSLRKPNYDKQKLGDERYETQVLLLDLKRPSTNENNYARFAERNIKRVQQRHRRHANYRSKNKPATEIKTQKRMTEMLEPW